MKKGNLNFLIIKHKKTNVNVFFDNQEKINVFNAENVQQDLNDIIRVPGTNLNLSLKGIKFIDSSGFKALNRVARIADNYDSSIVLKDIDPDLKELIILVKKFGNLNIRTIR